MMQFRSHGITRDKSLMTHEPDGPWYYQQIELGYNYRLTDLQAALVISQMKRIEEFIKIRQSIADIYDRELADLPLILPSKPQYAESANHLYIIRLKLDEILPLTHNKVFQELRNKDILVNLHYIPVHTQPYYQSMGFKWGDFPMAEEYYRTAISIPIYPMLTDESQNYVIQSLHQVIGQ